MSLAANMIGAGWKTDGLPARMIPLTVAVEVRQTKSYVQLERDGRMLTQADRLPSWRLRRDGDPD